MSQFDFGNIDPNSKSGTQLASDLNSWRDALHSGHIGASRPSYAQAGMFWIDNSADPLWVLNLYDGANDIVWDVMHRTDIQKYLVVPVNTGDPTAPQAGQLHIDELGYTYAAWAE